MIQSFKSQCFSGEGFHDLPATSSLHIDDVSLDLVNIHDRLACVRGIATYEAPLHLHSNL